MDNLVYPFENIWQDSPELIRFVDERTYNWSGKGSGVFILSDELPKQLNPKTVRALSLYEDIPKYLYKIPRFVKEFINLEYLHIPSYTMITLKPGDIPENLLVLAGYTGVSGVDGQFISIPMSVILPNLQGFSVTGVPCLFNATNFPALVSLYTELDRKQQILSVLPSMRMLRGLTIGPIRDTKFFEAIYGLSLEYLSLSNGKLAHIDEIEAIESLRGIRLSIFRKLESIAPICKLPQIEDVMIQECPRVKDWEVLTCLAEKPLRELVILECGKLELPSVRSAFEQKAVRISVI